jgi:hypothetical protein
MGNAKVGARIAIGRVRILSVLKKHGIATARTLEQKISDAGPSNIRIDPLHLTHARELLEKSLEVKTRKIRGTPWYFRSDTPSTDIDARLALQLPIHDETNDPTTTNLIGQALEIAVFRALASQKSLTHLGGFSDLDSHGDDRQYTKEENLVINGSKIPGTLDFLVTGKFRGVAGIEVKNIRPWIYPNNKLVRELLLKCCIADLVPVLIARRISYVVRAEVFEPCGIIVHETYNQLYPESKRDLADKAKDKTLLGYHDIRIGNQPDARLNKFIHINLPKLLPKARRKFDRHKDLLQEFAASKLDYKTFWRELRIRRKKPPFTDPVVPPDEPTTV